MTFVRIPRPGAMRFYGTSDYAVTAGGGDYTRLVVWGVDGRMNLWRMASWGGQTSSDVWIERQCDLIEEFRRRGGGIRRWFGEAGPRGRTTPPTSPLEAIRDDELHGDFRAADRDCRYGPP